MGVHTMMQAMKLQNLLAFLFLVYLTHAKINFKGICIKDSSSRVYSTFMDMGSESSVDKCVKFCSTYNKRIPDTNKGFPFAGIQIGHQCFCGSYLPSDLIRPRSECTQNGGWRMMVYRTGIKQPGQ